MSEFSGLWKQQNNTACTEIVKISVLKLDTIPYSEELQEEEQNYISSIAVLMENMSVKEANQEVIITKMVTKLQSIKTNLQQKVAQCTHAESTHKGVNYYSKHVTQAQQQKLELPTVTLTWLLVCM